MLYIDAGWYCDLTISALRHATQDTDTTSALKPKPQPFHGQESHQPWGGGRLDRVMQHLPGQDIPPGGRWRGCVRGDGGGAQRGTPAGRGQTGRPTVALPPASVRRAGRRLHTQQIPPPAPDQAVPVNPYLRVLGNLAWPLPSTSYPRHTPHPQSCAIKFVL